MSAQRDHFISLVNETNPSTDPITISDLHYETEILRIVCNVIDISWSLSSNSTGFYTTEEGTHLIERFLLHFHIFLISIKRLIHQDTATDFSVGVHTFSYFESHDYITDLTTDDLIGHSSFTTVYIGSQHNSFSGDIQLTYLDGHEVETVLNCSFRYINGLQLIPQLALTGQFSFVDQSTTTFYINCTEFTVPSRYTLTAPSTIPTLTSSSKEVEEDNNDNNQQ